MYTELKLKQDHASSKGQLIIECILIVELLYVTCHVDPAKNKRFPEKIY
jgi:hypothetical protein